MNFYLDLGADAASTTVGVWIDALYSGNPSDKPTRRAPATRRAAPRPKPRRSRPP